MPTYEYACKSCGRHVEIFQRISDAPPTACPHCGGQLRKVFHPAGILLKGSGFYKTDNRKKATSESSSSSSSSSSSDSTSSGSSGSGSSSSASSDKSKDKSKDKSGAK